ncbi:MAG: lipopolysaccharide core heptose(I) kinase RfaP [Planctomycetota bacterium]
MTIFAEAPFDALFERTDPFGWSASVEGEVFREAGGRRTVRFELEGRSWFLKVHAPPSLPERVKEWSSLRRPPEGARQEARALAALARAGLRVPRVAAWAERAGASFIVTEDVGTQETIGTLLARGALEVRDARTRRALIDAVADLIGRMHRAGVNHRDCYLVHVSHFGVDDAGAPRLGLMDLHRAGVRDQVPPRWRAKDLGALGFSAEAAALTPAERLRFRARYARAAGIGREDALWRRVERRIARLEAERARRGERFGG